MSIASVPGFDNLNTPMIMINRLGVVVYRNKSAKNKYSRLMIGVSLSRLVSEDTAERFSKLLDDEEPAIIRLREPESQNTYRAAAGGFVYAGENYFMLIFIETLHLDTSEVLFENMYSQMPLFWKELGGLLNMLLENNFPSKNSEPKKRFRSRMNELINITAGQYLSEFISRPDIGAITLKQLIFILNDAAESVPARYDCKLRFEYGSIDDSTMCGISVDPVKYLASFFMSLLPLMGISSDRYVTVGFEINSGSGELITNLRTRIPDPDTSYGPTNDFSLLAELYPKEALNLCIYSIMSKMFRFKAEHTVGKNAEYYDPNNGLIRSDGISFSITQRLMPANILILRSQDENEAATQLASLPLEIMYGLLCGDANGCDRCEDQTDDSSVTDINPVTM